MRESRRLARIGFVALGVAAFVLGFRGLGDALSAEGADRATVNVLASTVGLFFGEGLALITSDDVPASLQFARLAAPVVSAFATFQLFRTRAERTFRRARARRRSGHVVLVGLGASGRLIAEQLRLHGESCVIAIDEDGGAPADLVLFDRPRWAIITGNATDPEVLEAAGAQNAALVHVATGQDGVDIDVAVSLRRLGPSRTLPDPLDVKVQIDSPTLSRRLLQQELERVDAGRVLVEFVNLGGLSAAAVLEFMMTELADSSDESMVGTFAQRMRLVGNTGLLRELSSLCRRSHQARQMLGVPTLCQFEPVWVHESADGDPAVDEVAQTGDLPFATISIVHHDDGRRTIDEASVLSSHRPRDLVIALCPTGKRPVRNPARSDSGLVVLVDPGHLVQTPDLLSYGPIELMARLIHLDYLHSTAGHAVVGSGDARRPWSELSVTYKRANRAQAYDFGAKLGEIDCELSDVRDDPAVLTDAEIEMLAKGEHERWMKERRDDNWTFGETRDDEHRKHPDLRAYEELSEATKEKDRRAVVRLPALAALIGLTVVRKI